MSNPVPALSQMLELRARGGTAGEDISPPPEVHGTRTAITTLTDEAGWIRSHARVLHQEADELHQRIHLDEWRRRTAERARFSVADMLSDIAELGFAWRDVARLVGVSVPAVQKWRRGAGVSGESRLRVGSLLAACDVLAKRCLVQDIASWFEMPLVADVPITPMDLYVSERPDLVFDFAGGHIADPEQVLTDFDPDWRERYRSDFEVFQSDDGQRSIRPKAS
jgi:hypothetical protein